ncbi:X-domain of DnaJ-containing-domain-containing protein [Phaeosphaeria sp. MPI-PUGE-AT-0046c]|nr:X-domain of DnaJ-containing-domain-containing protein [Phaeosphaeria sp. MPI-PUGE-AT-0046c]
MKDLTKTMEISMREMEEQEAAAAEVERAEAAKVEAESSAAGAAGAGQTSGTTGAVPAAAPADTTTTTTTPSAAAKAKEAEAEAERTAAQSADAPPAYGAPPPAYAEPVADSSTTTGTTSPPPAADASKAQTRIPIRAAIMDKSEEDARMEAAGMTDAEKELREKQKKKAGLTKEQREELAAYELERKKIREERIASLSKKLVDRISVWTETDKASDVTAAFKEKIHLEIENLKMESFGLEILHAIGATYIMKASSFLKSQKFLGISGFFSRIKDKGTLVKDTWSTMSAAIDAQLTMEEMAKLEEQGGEAWTDEKKAEYEKKVTGKILAAAWRGSKFEIQSVLRDVCDSVLNDKRVKLEKRVERAHALVLIGEMFQKAERDPEEEGDFMAFEQLMAEAAAKKENKHEKHHHDKKDKKKEKEKA